MIGSVPLYRIFIRLYGAVPYSIAYRSAPKYHKLECRGHCRRTPQSLIIAKSQAFAPRSAFHPEYNIKVTLMYLKIKKNNQGKNVH